MTSKHFIKVKSRHPFQIMRMQSGVKLDTARNELGFSKCDYGLCCEKSSSLLTDPGKHLYKRYVFTGCFTWISLMRAFI